MSPPHCITWRELGVQALVALAVTIALWPHVFFHGEVALPGYALYDRYPWKEYTPTEYRPITNSASAEVLFQFVVWTHVLERAVENGEWPLWNPLECTGMPLHANYQSAAFYPTRLAHAFFSVHVATTIFLLFRFWWTAMTTYICGRALAMRPGVARFFAFGWTLSQYCMTWAYHQEAEVASWLPVLFLGVEWLIDRRIRRGFWTTAIGATMLLFAGHPETALVMGAGLGVYFFIRLALQGTWRDLVRPLAAAAGAWLVALLANAVNILPFVEYMLHSYTLEGRAAGEARREFLHPTYLAALFAPRFYGFTSDGNYWAARHSMHNTNFVSIVYPGMAVWVGLAALLARGGGDPTHRARVLALLIPSTFGFLLAYRVPTLEFVHELPVIGSMWGIHHATFALFALPLLAALALERWLSWPRTAADLLRLSPVLLGIAAIAAGYRWFFSDTVRTFELIGKSETGDFTNLVRYVDWQLAKAALFGLFGIALLALRIRGGRQNRIAEALALALAADLFVAARHMRPTAPLRHLYPETQLTTFLREGPVPARVSAASARSGGEFFLLPYDIPILWGYDGIYPERFMRFAALAAEPQVWQRVEPLLALKYYLHDPGAYPEDKDPPGFRRIGRMDNIDVYENLRALPRAFLVGCVRSVNDAGELFDMMRSEGFDPIRCALTDAAPNGPLPSSGEAKAGAARVVRQTPNRVWIETDAAAAAVLVLSEAWYPGWKAYVDGVPAEVFPVYHNFRGVVVPQGKHSVAFRFEPMSFHAGLWLSAITFLLGGIAAAYTLIQSRARDA